MIVQASLEKCLFFWHLEFMHASQVTFSIIKVLVNITAVGMASNHCLNNHRDLIPAAPTFDITVSNSLEERGWQGWNTAGGQINAGGVQPCSELL